MTLTDHLPLSVKSVKHATGWPRGHLAILVMGDSETREKRAVSADLSRPNSAESLAGEAPSVTQNLGGANNIKKR